eukprot:3887501-Amphidinium_carterae.1
MRTPILPEVLSSPRSSAWEDRLRSPCCGYPCESGCVLAFLGRRVFSTAPELLALEVSPAVPGDSPACSNRVRMRFLSSAITSSASGSPGCRFGFGCSSLEVGADRWRNRWRSAN